MKCSCVTVHIDILSFYEKTLNRLVPCENSVHSTVKGCLLECKQRFASAINKQADEVAKTSMTFSSLDLTPSYVSKELCKQMKDMLKVYSLALSNMPHDDSQDNITFYIDTVLGNMIQPLLQSCRMTSQALADIGSQAVFMLNNVHVMQFELRASAKEHPVCVDVTKVWIDLLDGEVSSWLDVLVREEVSRLLSRSEFDELLDLINLSPWRQQQLGGDGNNSTQEESPPEATAAALESFSIGQERMATVVSAFYNSLFELSVGGTSQFERLASIEMRDQSQLRLCKDVLDAYSKVLIHFSFFM